MCIFRGANQHFVLIELLNVREGSFCDFHKMCLNAREKNKNREREMSENSEFGWKTALKTVFWTLAANEIKINQVY